MAVLPSRPCLRSVRPAGTLRGTTPGFGLRSPDRLSQDRGDEVSQVPGVPTDARALFSDPGGTLAPGHRRQDAAFRSSDGVGSRDQTFSGLYGTARTPPCLRFTPRVAPWAARLGSGWWPAFAGQVSPAGYRKDFPPGPSSPPFRRASRLTKFPDAPEGRRFFPAHFGASLLRIFFSASGVRPGRCAAGPAGPHARPACSPWCAVPGVCRRPPRLPGRSCRGPRRSWSRTGRHRAA